MSVGSPQFVAELGIIAPTGGKDSKRGRRSRRGRRSGAELAPVLLRVIIKIVAN